MNARSVPGTSNVPWVDALDQDTIPCFTGPSSSHGGNYRIQCLHQRLHRLHSSGH
ncbi:Uncharacterized protein APZ42_010037 [Daphnia magna]|uniref:Uncharacterized protein n=1 Tax=Daphnia magna TaxID=35525 RepID=A0A162BPT0_9CRUS|nr:Uncharacterized protein APZ42_010037 [Daphnia magna]